MSSQGWQALKETGHRTGKPEAESTHGARVSVRPFLHSFIPGDAREGEPDKKEGARGL